MRAHRQHRFRLGLEPLEDRVVLSSFTVTSDLDLLNTPGTLRDAVNQANLDGAKGIADTIYFASSLSGAHILLQLGPLELTAGASVYIWGTSSTVPSVILNGDSDSIFRVDYGASLTLNLVTLAGGTALGGNNGGAINNAGTLTLQDCTLTDNSAKASVDTGAGGLGGAVYNTGTLVTSYTNTFSDNSALSGGAIANGPGGIASLENDVYSSIPATSSSPAIPGNSATQDGGAIYNAGAMTVYGCTISGNKAEFGGGLFNGGGTVTLNSATLAGNTATGPLSGTSAGIGSGGAIDNAGAMTLTATTVSGNSGYQGGGISCGAPGDGDSLTLVDSIVAGNSWSVGSNPPAKLTAPFYPDVYNATVTASTAYNLIGDGTGLSGISDGVQGNQVGSSSAPINPLLAPLGNYGGLTETMPLLSCSPALVAGGPVTTLTAAIGAQDTVIPVADAAVFESTPLTMGFEIDGELMWVRSVDLTNNTVTVSRSSSPGYAAPTSHNAGAGLNFLSNPLGETPPSNAPSLGSAQPGSNQLIVTSASYPESATAGTLRSAVSLANKAAAQGISDTIIFATAQMGTSSISLSQGQLELQAGTGTTTIDGGGQVEIGGGGSSGVFLVDGGAHLDLTGLSVENGQAAAGGGIDNNGTLSVTNCTIANNDAGGSQSGGNGGGIYNAGTANLTGITVADNTVASPTQSNGDGGGIYNTGTLMLVDCTLAGNTVGSKSAGPDIADGGAIYNGAAAGANATLTATTIYGNTAFHGGGIANSGSLTLTDTIVIANDDDAQSGGNGPNILGSVSSTSAYNMVGNPAGMTGMSSAAQYHNQVGVVVPGLAPLGNYGGNMETMPLLPGSPALGAGIAVASVSTDECGQPLATPPDIGACQTVGVAQFGVTVLGTAMAGIPFNVVITAENSSQQPVAYNGPVTLTTSDNQPVNPGNSPFGGMPTSNPTFTLTGGSVTASVTLDTPEANPITLTATAGTANGTSGNINLVSQTADHFVVSVSGSGPQGQIVAGQPTMAFVTAYDANGSAYGDICKGDCESVSLSLSGHPTEQTLYCGTSSSSLGTSDSVTLNGGEAVFYVMLKKSEHEFSLVAAQGSATGGTPIVVIGGPPTGITETLQTIYVTAGTPFTLTIAATDQYGNQTDAAPLLANGAPKVTCSDPKQPLTDSGFTAVPDPSGLGRGTIVDQVKLTLYEKGTITLNVAAKTAAGKTITPTSLPSFTVAPGLVDHFTVVSSTDSVTIGTPFNVTVTPYDAYGNVTMNFPDDKSVTVQLAAGPVPIPLSPASINYFTQPQTVPVTLGVGTWPESTWTCSNQMAPFTITATATTAAGNSLKGTTATAINITPDWFSANLPDLPVQQIARAKYYSNSPNCLGYDDMIAIYELAASELCNIYYMFPDQTNDVKQSLHALDASGSSNPSRSSTLGPNGLGMTGDLQYLVDQVTNPSSADINFLAWYYYNNPFHQSTYVSIAVQQVGKNWKFGDSGISDKGQPGSIYGSQVCALMDQWLLGNVYPADSVPKDHDPACPYSLPSGTLQLFGPSKMPEVNDVQQRTLGDCWLLAPVAAVAYVAPQLIVGMFDQHDNGTYTIRFDDGGQWKYETVDNELPSGGGVYDSPYVYNYTVMWVALLEKGIAQLWDADDNYHSGGYGYLAGSANNLESADVLALTGLGSHFTHYKGPTPNPAHIAGYLEQGEAVTLSTPSHGTVSTELPVDNGHDYACLAYDPSTDKFLFYNPWGPANPTTVFSEASPKPTNPNNDSFTVADATDIGVGDIIDVGIENMLVTGVDLGSNTLTVVRGFNHTPIGEHDAGDAVYLNIGHEGIQNDGLNASWTQIEKKIIPSSPEAKYGGLFALPASWLNQFYKESNTTTGAPSPRSGSLAAGVGLSVAPAGMGPLSGSPPAHRRAWKARQPSPRPVPSMVRLPARWARLDATVKPRRSPLAT